MSLADDGRLLERLHEAVQHHRRTVAADQQARAEIYALVRANADTGTEMWAIAELVEVTTERVRQILARPLERRRPSARQALLLDEERSRPGLRALRLGRP